METQINNLENAIYEHIISVCSNGNVSINPDKINNLKNIIDDIKKQSVVEFKKSLIQEVNNTSFKIVNLEQDKIDDILRGTLINLIDNIGKEK